MMRMSAFGNKDQPFSLLISSSSNDTFSPTRT
jgi:hypothetical protein